MKPLLVFSAATLLVFAPALATGFRPQEATPAPTAPVAKNPVKPTAASQEKAKKLFEQDCAMCHGSNGNGKTEIETTKEQVRLRRQVSAIKAVITRG